MRDLLPRSPLARALLLAVMAIVIVSLILALWATGGLAKAPEAPPSKPGRPIGNALFTITPHTAAIGTSKGVSNDPVVEIHAEIVTSIKEPLQISSIDGIIRPSVMPAKTRAKNLTAVFKRNPEAFYSELQPQVREKVVLTWPLPKKVEPDSVESIDLTVLEAQRTGGFWDERERWGAGEERAGTVELPIEGG